MKKLYTKNGTYKVQDNGKFGFITVLCLLAIGIITMLGFAIFG